MEANVEQEEPQSKRRKLSTRRNQKNGVQTSPHRHVPASVGACETVPSVGALGDQTTAAKHDEDFSKFCRELLSCHLRVIGNCDWRTLPDFPEFQAESDDDEKEEVKVVGESSGVSIRPGQNRCSDDSGSTKIQVKTDSSILPPVIDLRTNDEWVALAVPRKIKPEKSSEPKKSSRFEAKDGSMFGGHSASEDGNAASTIPCAISALPSTSAAVAQYCPICHFEFPTGMEQMETDSHIAACLAATSDDFTW